MLSMVDVCLKPSFLGKIQSEQPFQKLGSGNYIFIMSNLKTDNLTKCAFNVLLFNHLKEGL